jgi:hypothetical protein
MASVVLEAACGGTPDDASASSQAASGARPKITDSEFVTSMTTARAMQPYNNIVDSTLSGTPCVELASGSAAEPEKAVARSEVSLQQVASRSSLALAIGADATVKAGIAPGPNVEAGVHLLDRYDTSKSTLTFLLTSTKEVTQSYPGDYHLTSSAETLLRSDPKRFAKQCGRAFVTGTTRSATLYALVQVHVEDEEAAAALAANVGGSRSIGGVGDVTANMSTHIAALRDKLGLKVTVDVLMDGFSTTLSVPTLDMSQLTPVTTEPATPDPGPKDPNAAQLPPRPADAAATDKALASFSQQLKSMLDAAQVVQQDTIDGKGSAAPRLTKVAVVGYRTLATPAELDAKFAEVDGLLKGAQDFLRDVLTVRNQITNVVEFEIEPYLRATRQAALGTGLVAYNRRALAADGSVDATKFIADPDTLRRLASAWHEDFAGEDDTTTRGAIELLLDDCFTSAQNGDYASCDRAAAKPVLDAARGRLAAYAAEGRILPVVFASGASGPASDRATKCGPGWHVASGKREIGALAMVVPESAGAAGPKTSVWVDDAPIACGTDPYFSVAGNAGTFACRADDFFHPWSLPTLCVPRSGPFGLVGDVPGEVADKF